MGGLWLLLLPIGGMAWWLFGFPPGWGWALTPVMPDMPVTFGMVLVLGLGVLGLYGVLSWVRGGL